MLVCVSVRTCSKLGPALSVLGSSEGSFICMIHASELACFCIALTGFVFLLIFGGFFLGGGGGGGAEDFFLLKTVFFVFRFCF